jgi:hypothetical protein
MQQNEEGESSLASSADQQQQQQQQQQQWDVQRRPRRAAARRALSQMRAQSHSEVDEEQTRGGMLEPTSLLGADAQHSPTREAPSLLEDDAALEPGRVHLSEANLPLFMHYCKSTCGISGAELAAIETAAMETLYISQNHRAAWEYVIAAGRDRYRDALRSADRATLTYSESEPGSAERADSRRESAPAPAAALPSDAVSRRELLALQYERLLARKRNAAIGRS